MYLLPVVGIGLSSALLSLLLGMAGLLHFSNYAHLAHLHSCYHEQSCDEGLSWSIS